MPGSANSQNSVHKNERLEVRVSGVQKELVQRAAHLQGRTLSDFVATSVQRAAEQAIREHEVITLTARESRVFVEALLAPPAPNDHLRALADRYRRTTHAED